MTMSTLLPNPLNLGLVCTDTLFSKKPCNLFIKFENHFLALEHDKHPVKI